MKKISLNEMEELQGGDFITGLCTGIGVSGAVTAVGANAAALGIAAANIWNPAGWVVGFFAVSTIACAGYVAANGNF